MKTYKISANSPFTVPVVFITVLSAAWLILNLLPIPVEGQFEPKWINPVLAAVLLIPFGFLSFKMHRRSLTLHENDMVYIPLLGAPRTMSYSDLQKISIGGKSYCLYTSDGKVLLRFDDAFTSNASDIVAFLKSKVVKAEL